MRTSALTLLLMLVAMPLFGQSAQELFSRGNESYRAGRYEEAAAAYEQIIGRGETSAAVYFNLGNSYYRAGKIAPAILAFERSARLDPSDPDVRHNLRLLSLKTVDRIEAVPELFLVQWMRSLAALVSPGTARSFFLVAWGILFIALASLYLISSPALIRVARAVALASFILVLLGGVMLGLQRFNDDAAGLAIVTAPTVTAKSSPDAGSVDAFVIHEGLKVRLSDAVGGWTKVTLPDGKVGWIQASQCERI
jgi:tetratricopeptide (TPR) repeat protein